MTITGKGERTISVISSRSEIMAGTQPHSLWGERSQTCAPVSIVLCYCCFVRTDYCSLNYFIGLGRLPEGLGANTIQLLQYFVCVPIDLSLDLKFICGCFDHDMLCVSRAIASVVLLLSLSMGLLLPSRRRISDILTVGTGTIVSCFAAFVGGVT